MRQRKLRRTGPLEHHGGDLDETDSRKAIQRDREGMRAEARTSGRDKRPISVEWK